MTLWFLLYGGQSADGRGFPVYIGRTTDAKKAKKHLSNIKSPLSIGNVTVVTDTRMIVLTPYANLKSFDEIIANLAIKD